MDLSIKGTQIYKSLLLEQRIALIGATCGDNMIITGGGGVGKSHLIKSMGRTIRGIVLTSTTGGSALDIGGETIDSFMGFRGKLMTTDEAKRMSPVVRERLEVTKTLLIDEASMLRKDKLMCIDARLRSAKKEWDKPFGGVQLILVGDFCQFGPVLGNQEKEKYHSEFGRGVHLFESDSYKNAKFVPYVLTEYVRQKGDIQYRRAMQSLRLGRNLDKVTYALNNLTASKPHKDAVFLCTTRKVAESRNTEAFALIPGKSKVYHAKYDHGFKESMFPTKATLTLKVGARVMVVANNAELGYYNGDTGTVKTMFSDRVVVNLDRGGVVEVKPHTWESIIHEASEGADSKGELDAVVEGEFKQIPLMLAYAMTIHKSQGKTLPNVSIDFGTWVTQASGYVGFSRAQSYQGVHMVRPLKRSDLLYDRQAVGFTLKISTEAMERREQDILRFGVPPTSL